MGLARPKGDGFWGLEAQQWAQHLEREKVEAALNQYAESDYNMRMSMWLEHRDLRGAFDIIEQAFLEQNKKPQGRLRWLRRCC